MTRTAPGVSVVYLTHRMTPRFDWFADGFARQIVRDADVEVVLVDGFHSSPRAAEFEAVVDGRFPFRHVPAKPTPYAGPHRRTRADYFSAASARNTGIVHATKPYVVFVDDLSVLMPGWWAEVQDAARRGEVAAGAYQKHWEMVVEDGVLVSSRSDASGVDSRWSIGDDGKAVRVGGGQLFGCSLGAPRDLLLEIGGFDELCDSVGGEDWQFGLRIEFAGAPIFYRRRMLTIESEEGHRIGIAPIRVDRAIPPSVYSRRLREFGVTSRHVAGNWDSSHMILDLVFGVRTSQPLGNYYLLSRLMPDTLHEVERGFPRVHWFDRRPLAEL